jgi:hypothetical protein
MHFEAMIRSSVVVVAFFLFQSIAWFVMHRHVLSNFVSTSESVLVEWQQQHKDHNLRRRLEVRSSFNYYLSLGNVGTNKMPGFNDVTVSLSLSLFLESATFWE